MLEGERAQQGVDIGRQKKGTGLQVPVTSASVTSGRGEGQSFINLATWRSSPSFKLLVNTAEE